MSDTKARREGRLYFRRIWSKTLTNLRYYFDPSPLHLHPVDLSEMGCGAGYPATMNFKCTRVISHPGSHMAAANNDTVAMWDEELMWDRWNGWMHR